jgi:catechol 2,3-dioxygenase-like lactoylglutathione lyase family enzyme
MEMELRVELFVADLDAFVDFYTRVLGFEIAADRRHEDPPYAAVRRGHARFGGARSWSPVDRSARAVPNGTELVLEADDLTAERNRVVAADWPLEQDLTERPWGLTDFRLYDPDGYYLRVTTKS